ncbi:MAG: ribose ABC transporter permease [Clostridiales bacterium]|nr:ribose ABC transporter permease [Clostridiales bacterium]
MNSKILFKYKSLIGLIGFAVIISFLNPRFLTTPNLLNILRQTSINSLIAVGMTFVIITGGIDLSVGSSLALTGAISAWLIISGVHPVVAFVATLGAGSLIGVVNGLIISKGKAQPFIATLAVMTAVRGITLLFTDGRPLGLGHESNAEVFSKIGTGFFLGIPIPVYIMIIAFGVAYYTLRHTRLGRRVYALGGNEEASVLSGINVDQVKIAVYGISGMLAAVAGVVITARLNSAQPTAGSGYELDAIAAVVLGGTSLTGGVGSVLGTIVGVLIIGVLNNSLNLMNVSSHYQLLIKGVVILVAVLIDRKK